MAGKRSHREAAVHAHKGTAYAMLFRLLPGNITDKSSSKKAVLESEAKHVTLIGNKGLYSKKNSSCLDSLGLKYIIPLHSNTKTIDDDVTAAPEIGKFVDVSSITRDLF